MKKISLDYIAKSEGHVGLEAKIIDQRFAQARMEIKEASRFIEKNLKNKKIEDVPKITSRICGVCPVAHNLASIKAIESALKIKIPEKITILRKLLEASQIIQSHIFHIFFLALSDYFNLKDSLDLVKLHPKIFKKVLLVRNFANRIIEVISGRSVHPISSIIGGFAKESSRAELKKILNKQKEILNISFDLVNFFKQIEFPDFSRPTEFIALKSEKEYAFYQGEIISNKGLKIFQKEYSKELKEFQRPHQIVNLVKHRQSSYITGPIARINLSASQLNKGASQALKELKFNLPNYNSFYNLAFQMIEVIHFLEETGSLLKQVLKNNSKKYRVSYKCKSGQGTGIIEAPRGLLIHSYQIDKFGRIKKANIITPTAQFLLNLEKDLEKYIPQLKNLNPEQRRKRIKMLVRAYDLCISCAVQ